MYVFALLDDDECEVNNGGCDSKRDCINKDGSRECGDCPPGWIKDGETACKGLCPLANTSRSVGAHPCEMHAPLY